MPKKGKKLTARQKAVKARSKKRYTNTTADGLPKKRHATRKRKK